MADIFELQLCRMTPRCEFYSMSYLILAFLTLIFCTMSTACRISQQRKMLSFPDIFCVSFVVDSQRSLGLRISIIYRDIHTWQITFLLSLAETSISETQQFGSTRRWSARRRTRRLSSCSRCSTGLLNTCISDQD